MYIDKYNFKAAPYKLRTTIQFNLIIIIIIVILELNLILLTNIDMHNGKISK